MIIWPQKRHNDVRYTVSEWVCEVVIQHITVTSIILFKVYNFLRQMRLQYEYFPGIFNDLSQTQNCVPCLDHNLWKETVVILAPKTEFWTFSEFIVTACSVLARSKSGLRLPCPPHLLLPLHLRAPGPAPDTCLWFVNPLIPSLSLFAPPPLQPWPSNCGEEAFEDGARALQGRQRRLPQEEHEKVGIVFIMCNMSSIVPSNWHWQSKCKFF